MRRSQTLKEAGYELTRDEEKGLLNNSEKVYKGTYKKKGKPSFDVYYAGSSFENVEEIVIPYCEGTIMNIAFYLAIILQGESLEEIERWHRWLINRLGIK